MEKYLPDFPQCYSQIEEVVEGDKYFRRSGSPPGTATAVPHPLVESILGSLILVFLFSHEGPLRTNRLVQAERDVFTQTTVLAAGLQPPDLRSRGASLCIR